MKRGPVGDLHTFAKSPFTHEGSTYDVYRKGTGPAVLVLTEIPGISPRVLGFADTVVSLGCSVALPDLFGDAGRDPESGGPLGRARYSLKTIAKLCINREFNMFVANKTSPVSSLLRALIAHEHERCGGPGVGVVGMCFTGGYALALATDPRVLAPVLSQPSIPVGPTDRAKRSIDCSPAELAQVKVRCAREGLEVLGLRFDGDPLVPPERFEFLRRELGDAFVGVSLAQRDGHPDEPLARHHSVLTGALIDEPGQPTRAALDRVLELFRRKLLTA